ncbi:MAG: carotenoid biosynthesis protein [Aureispira sp.]
MNDKTIAIQAKFERHAPWILCLFHVIGIGLFLYPDRPQGLSGLNMLLCTALVLGSAHHYQKESWAVVGIMLGGFTVEAIGVNTGLLFGSYEYGQELGWKILGVPVVLGFNWYCVVAASSHLVKRWLPATLPLVLRAALVGALCTGMDFLIEPVAMAYDFWDWEGHVVPIFNYVCWWIFATIFAALYLHYIQKINKTAHLLFFVWLLFFLILNAVGV